MIYLFIKLSHDWRPFSLLPNDCHSNPFSSKKKIKFLDQHKKKRVVLSIVPRIYSSSHTNNLSLSINLTCLHSLLLILHKERERERKKNKSKHTNSSFLHSKLQRNLKFLVRAVHTIPLPFLWYCLHHLPHTLGGFLFIFPLLFQLSNKLHNEIPLFIRPVARFRQHKCVRTATQYQIYDIFFPYLEFLMTIAVCSLYLSVSHSLNSI